MSVADKHSVPATLAGFIAQLDIALAWLSEGDVHATVGVETLDDVARADGGESSLGQSKISFSRNPLTDQSVNLWSSLKTWLDMLDSGECDLDHTCFLLITNFPATGIVASLRDAGASANGMARFVQSFRRTAIAFEGACKPLVDAVLLRTNDTLAKFFRRIKVADEHCVSPSEQLPSLQGRLNLTDDIAEDVIRGLRGWVVEKVQEKLAERKPAWLDRQHFCDELYRLIDRYRNRTLYLRTVREFVINEADRELHRDATFVRQLQLIGIDDGDDEVLDAINDFLMSASERTRLSKETNITRSGFEAFEDRLIEHWKPLHRQCRRNSEDPAKSGYETYCKVQEHREPLDGHDTIEFYFTRGTYHQLANGEKESTPKVGWHPDFAKLV
jgi:hypothetical protein